MRLLLIFVGVSVAIQHSLNLVPFKPRNEYVYRFEGNVYSGVPFSNDGSVARIQAMVHMQTIDDRIIVLKLKNIRLLTAENERVRDIDEMKHRIMSKQHLELLEMPVRFSYKNGMIGDIQFSEQDEEWSKNVKRSIINMLQINLQKIGKIEDVYMDKELMTRDNDFFKVNERTIEGDCEVAYTIVKMEDSSTEVTKSVNFDKCTQRPQVKYSFRHMTKCNDCEKVDTFEPSTVYTYRLSNDGLKSVQVVSVYTITIENQPIMKTEIRAKLTLDAITQIMQWFESVNGRIESLVYSNQMEKHIERFYMYGDNAEVLPYERVTEKIQAIRKIIDELKMQKENDFETTDMLSRLVPILRMCSLDELSVIHSEIYTRNDKRMKAIIEHSLAIAGTKNTITHLLRHVEKQNMKTYRIVSILKSIQETPYPSSNTVEELLRFSDSNIVKRSPVVRQTIWLAIGSVMRGVVGDTMDEKLLMENRRELKQRYLNILLKQYEKADDIYEKVLYLKSLANAGIDLSVYELEKIIMNKNEETAVRMEAIDALRLFKNSMPRKTKAILLPMYKNRAEQPELRMAALVRIMHTLPNQPVVIQIISTMEREPNQQVAAFTYNLLNSFVRSTHSCYKKLANDIRPFLAISRNKRDWRMLSSTYKFIPMFTENLMSGINFEFATIFGKQSSWPKEMMISADTVISGMWNKYLLQLGLSQQNIEQMINKVTQKLIRMEKNTQSMTHGRRIRDSLTLLRSLAQKLNIRPRVISDKTAHAMFYVRYKEMDYAVLPLDEKIIDDILEKYIKNGKLEKKELDYLFNRDPEFQLHMLTYFYENIRKVPTTLGLSITMKDIQPTVGSAEGTFTFEKISSGVRIHLDTSPSIASMQTSEMKLWNPIFEQGVKTVRSIEARLPIDFDVEMLYTDQIEFKCNVNLPNGENMRVRLWSHPVTFFRLMCGEKYFAEREQKTIVIPKWKASTEENERVLNIWGAKAVLRENFIDQWDTRDVLLGDYSWEFVLSPSRDSPKKMRIYMNTGVLEKARLNRIDSNYLFDNKFDIEPTRYENYEEKERRNQFSRLASDVERSMGYKHRMNIRVEAVDSNIERYGNIELVSVCDEKLHYCKMTVEAKCSLSGDEQRDWRLKTIMQIFMPKIPNTLMELKNQVHREIQGQIQSSWGVDEKNEVNIKFQMEQSKEQKQWMKVADKDFKGLTAYDILHQASLLNQLKVVVDYKVTPFVKNFIQRIYQYWKAYTFWYDKVTMHNGEQGKVFLKLTVDPISRSLLNALLETSNERLEMKDINIPQIYLPSIAKRSLRDFRDDLIKGQICEIKNNKIRTFDNLIFRAPITNCYSVIAKDCSEEPRFAVLLKKVTNDADEKVV
ncbi:lipoprotein amino terminal region [Dictyocaulus viviparus]|uniref:Lipoprotein amino terminal region n=1 Tax=Dictyocaulus viviparus TaxID=29172 RepID=A0A0D8XAC1_DICVI|nr:lipoprotein amino terminal region [Dictyocaulus viviparus]